MITLYGAEMEKLILLIWNEFQRLPATVYGEARAKGNFDVIVSQDPPGDRDHINANGGNAIVYNFAGSCGGGDLYY